MAVAEKRQQVWFGMKLTPQQKNRIKLLAQQKGTSAKQAIMNLVDEALASQRLKAPSGSFLDGLEDIVGSVEGPADLSSNPRHMDGFGR